MRPHDDRYPTLAPGTHVYTKFAYINSDYEWLGGRILHVETNFRRQGPWLIFGSVIPSEELNRLPIAYTIRLDRYDAVVTVHNNRVLPDSEYQAVWAQELDAMSRKPKRTIPMISFGQRVRVRVLVDRWYFWEEDDRTQPRVGELAGTVLEGVAVHINEEGFTLIEEDNLVGNDRWFRASDDGISIEVLG